MNLLFFVFAFTVVATAAAQTRKPLRVGVVGLVHTHVHWILGREDRGDIEIVGIVEPNADLASRYAAQHGYSTDIVFDTLEEMLDATAPEAVTVFSTIKDHRHVVEVAAQRGVHIMVEKPLAVSLEDAEAMAAVARANGVHLLTNYETTWYGSVHEVGRRVRAGDIGPLRKVVVHDGHSGPAEIGVNKEFLEWLIDPEYNGAGALTDFGCYGADLVTWLMDGRRPLSVTAITQQIKPHLYPLVDDEATIVLEYADAQAILQASWNWPFNRKDMEVYGRSGYAHADDGRTVRFRFEGDADEEQLQAESLESPVDDPFSFLAAVVRGDVDPRFRPEAEGEDVTVASAHTRSVAALSSLEVNLIVMEILDAAMQSAREGRTIKLEQ